MRKSRIVVLILILSLVAGLLFYFWGLITPKKGTQVIDFWEVKSGKIKVQVTAVSEVNSFVPGAYYVFDSLDSSNKKSEIMTFRHDDPIPINKDSVVFLSDQVAYIFMGWMYSVTIDGGKTWAVWDGSRNLRDWKCCNYHQIKDINLNEDGAGKMRLWGANDEITDTLLTTNYGRTWNISQ